MVDPVYVAIITGTLAILGIGVTLIGKAIPARDKQYEALMLDRTELRTLVDQLDAEVQTLRSDYWQLKSDHAVMEHETHKCEELYANAQAEIANMRAEIAVLVRAQRGGNHEA